MKVYNYKQKLSTSTSLPTATAALGCTVYMTVCMASIAGIYGPCLWRLVPKVNIQWGLREWIMKLDCHDIEPTRPPAGPHNYLPPLVSKSILTLLPA